MTEVEDSPAEAVEAGEKPEPLAGTLPVPGVEYPLKVSYCGECTLPLEYCVFGGRSEKCKEWLDKNLSQLMADGAQIQEEEDGVKEEKKHQKRGGKGGNPTKVVKVGVLLRPCLSSRSKSTNNSQCSGRRGARTSP